MNTNDLFSRNDRPCSSIDKRRVSYKFIRWILCIYRIWMLIHKIIITILSWIIISDVRRLLKNKRRVKDFGSENENGDRCELVAD